MIYKAQEISNGFKNLLKSKLGLTTKEEEKLFTKRAEICQSCEHGKDRPICGLCNCLLIAKTKSIQSTCPDGLW